MDALAVEYFSGLKKGISAPKLIDSLAIFFEFVDTTTFPIFNDLQIFIFF